MKIIYENTYAILQSSILDSDHKIGVEIVPGAKLYPPNNTKSDCIKMIEDLEEYGIRGKIGHNTVGWNVYITFVPRSEEDILNDLKK